MDHHEGLALGRPWDIEGIGLLNSRPFVVLTAKIAAGAIEESRSSGRGGMIGRVHGGLLNETLLTAGAEAAPQIAAWTEYENRS